jgi:hypothetical protein
MWKEAVVPNLRYYPSVCLEGLRNPTRNLSQDGWSPYRDLNPGCKRGGGKTEMSERSGEIKKETEVWCIKVQTRVLRPPMDLDEPDV